MRLSDTLPAAFALWGLLHDASEAYLVDLPRPLKHASGFGDLYIEAETQMMRAVCRKFDISETEPPCVKIADKIMLVTEQRDLMGRAYCAARDEFPPMIETIIPWPSEMAERMFLDRYFMLMRK